MIVLPVKGTREAELLAGWLELAARVKKGLYLTDERREQRLSARAEKLPGLDLNGILEMFKQGNLRIQNQCVEFVVHQGGERAAANQRRAGYGPRSAGLLYRMPEGRCRLQVIPGYGTTSVAVQATGLSAPVRVEAAVDITTKMLRAFRNSGYILVDPYLLSREWIKLLSKTFPFAVGLKAYGGGLFAPSLGTVTQDGDESVASICDLGEGRDGSGLIHPRHPLVKKTCKGVPSPLQIRAWNPGTGMFCKGILVPSEKALDANGRPGIWIDKLQVKGVLKGYTGPTKAGFTLGVIQKWMGEPKISVAFPFWERLRPTETAKEAIKASLQGLNLHDVEAEGPGIPEAVAVADALGVDRSTFPHVHDAWDRALSRNLWRARNGAGMSVPGRVIVMSERVKEGTICGWDLKGLKVGSARFPMLTASGLLQLRVAEAEDEFLISHRGSKTVPRNCVFMHPNDALKMQGDDDGDTVLMFQAENADLVLQRDYVFEDGEHFAFEPPKGEKGGKALVPTLDALKKKRGKAARRILGKDTMGPVGLLTLYASVFLAQGRKMEALACAVLVQYAIDSGKRPVQWPLFKPLTNPKNWRKTSSGAYTPKKSLKNSGVFGAFPKSTLKQLAAAAGKLDQTLTWREGVDNKAMSIAAFLSYTPPKKWRRNLVHYIAKQALSHVDLPVAGAPDTDRLIEKIDVLVGEGTYNNAHALSEELGFKEYGSSMSKALKSGGRDKDERVRLAEELLRQRLRGAKRKTLKAFVRSALFECRKDPSAASRWLKRIALVLASPKMSKVFQKAGLPSPATEAPKVCPYEGCIPKVVGSLPSHLSGSGESLRFSDIWAAVTSPKLWEWYGHHNRTDECGCMRTAIGMVVGANRREAMPLDEIASLVKGVNKNLAKLSEEEE